MNQFQLIVLLEVMACSMLPNQADPVKLCGDELIEALLSVCGDRGFYSHPQGYTRRTPATKSGVATQCCEFYCEMSVLETYCNLPATSQSQTVAVPPITTSEEDDRRTNEIAIDYLDQTGNNGSQMPRVDGTSGQESTTNKNKPSSTEIDEESYGNEGDAGEGKLDDSNPSERGESLPDEDTNNRDEPTRRPHRLHSKERGKNRTNKGSEKRLNSNRRRGSSERRTLTGGKREARQRRKGQQRLLRRQSNSKRRSKLEKKGAAKEDTVTTPVAVETAEHPFKNGGYNSTSGDLSLVNVTDTASASETKKDGFFTTITAVLRGVIGFQPVDDGNR